MSTTGKSPGPAHLRLTPRQRTASLLLAVLLAALTLWYIAWPRDARVAAPECMTGTECTVLVTAPVDGVIASALLLLTFLCALMTLTGVVLLPKFGGNELTTVPVEKLDRIPQDATRIVAATPAAQESQAPHEGSQGQVIAGPVQSGVLWATMPTSVQQALTVYATEHLDLGPAEVSQGIREIAVGGEGPGNPYYVRLDAHGQESILKLS